MRDFRQDGRFLRSSDFVSRRFDPRTVSLVLAVVLSGLTGSYFVTRSHAATATATSDVANGVVASPAFGVPDTTAAATNGAVKFTNALPSPNGIPGNWTLKFDDEFTGTTLDTTKWSTGWFGTGITQPVNAQEDTCYDPAQVTQIGGALVLALISKQETCGGTQRNYAGGLISSNYKYGFTYGAFEARIWLPGDASTVNDWPAWWADGQNWPQDGEIDVLEGLGGLACYHFHNPDGGPGDCVTPTGVGTGWHTYAADWQPGSLKIYYDGSLVWTDTTGITTAPMYLILNLTNEGYLTGRASVAPATMKVDYVRVWQ